MNSCSDGIVNLVKANHSISQVIKGSITSEQPLSIKAKLTGREIKSIKQFFQSIPKFEVNTLNGYRLVVALIVNVKLIRAIVSVFLFSYNVMDVGNAIERSNPLNTLVRGFEKEIQVMCDRSVLYGFPHRTTSQPRTIFLWSWQKP
jgi:hypothetical protein